MSSATRISPMVASLKASAMWMKVLSLAKPSVSSEEPLSTKASYQLSIPVAQNMPA